MVLHTINVKNLCDFLKTFFYQLELAFAKNFCLAQQIGAREP